MTSLTTRSVATGRTSVPPRSRHGLAGRIAGSTVKYVGLVAASVITLLPLVVLVITAFKTKREFATTGPLQLPKDWFNFDNFVTAFTDGNMAVGFRNTSIVLVVSLAGTILIGSMTAYAIDRFEFRMKKLVIALFLVATLVPGVTTQVATFQIVNGLGLYDSLWSLIALNLGTDIISIYIFLQFMQSIPKDVDEAAMLDGVSAWQKLRLVTIPMLKPALFLVTTLGLIGTWQVFDQIYVMGKGAPAGTTMTPAFLSYNTSFRSNGWGSGAAMAFIVFLIIVVITWGQRRLMRDDKTPGRLRRTFGVANLMQNNRGTGPTP